MAGLQSGLVCGDLISLAIQAYQALKTNELLREERNAISAQVAEFVFDLNAALSPDATTDTLEAIGAEFYQPIVEVLNGLEEGIAQAYGQSFAESLQTGAIDPAQGNVDAVQAFFSASSSTVLGDAITDDQLSDPDATYRPSAIRTTFREPAEEVECGDSVVQGAFASVASAATGLINRGANIAQITTSSFGMISHAIPKVLYGAAAMNVEQILSLFVDRDVILDKIIRAADRLAESVGFIEEEHYFPNLFSRAGKTIKILRRAVSALERVEYFMLENGVTDLNSYEQAIEYVEDAEEELCRLELLPDPTGYTYMMKLQTQINFLAILKRGLENKQDVLLGLQSLLVDFRGDLGSNARFDSLFIGLVTQVKCRIDKLIGRLRAAQKANRIETYITQQAAACIELQVLIPFMELVKQPLSQKLSLLDVDPIGEAVADIEVAAANLDIDSPDYQALINSMDLLITQARVSLTRYQDPAQVQALAEQVKSQAEAMKGQGQEFEQAVAVALVTLAGVRAVLDAVLGGFGDDPAISSIVENIRTGNWEKLFSIDAVTSSLEGEVAKLMSAAVACCEASGRSQTSQGAIFDLLDISEELADEARREALFHDTTTMFGSKSHKATMNFRIPLLKQQLGRAINAARADCFQ